MTALICDENEDPPELVPAPKRRALSRNASEHKDADHAMRAVNDKKKGTI